MLKNKYSILAITIMVLCNFANAQNSNIILLNGKKIPVSEYSINVEKDDSVVNYKTLSGKKRHKFADKVFAITNSNGKEHIIYYPNIEMGETFSIEQMRQYVNGRSFGNKTKISPLVSVGAFVLGAGSAFIPIPAINFGSSSMSLPIGMLVPIADIVVMGSVNTPEKVLAKKMEGNNYKDKDNEYYLMGVEESLRNKRIKHSIIGGVLGVIAGTITVIAIN